MKFRGILIVLAMGFAAPAAAQVQYGPWKKTNDCRPMKVPSVGFGRPNVPRVPGTDQAMECKWEREVTDCPRIRDKLRHPIRCTTKRQRSGYSPWPPSS